MKRRNAIMVLVGVIAVAAVIVAGAFTLRSMAAEKNAKRDLQYTYDRAYGDLRDCVDSISLTLSKSTYANTATQQNGLAARLLRETSLAKEALATLPVTDSTMDSVSKYIAQVGDFAMTLSNRISAGGGISAAEYKTIDSLHSYAQKLSTNLAALKPDYSTGKLSTQFKQTAQDFTNFPSLIYDGPFSDDISRKSPLALKGKAQVPQGNARAAAADILQQPVQQLTHVTDTGGNLPAYNFVAGSVRISMTKQGGLLASLHNSRESTAEKIDENAAQKNAEDFLTKHGYTNLQPSYWVKSDGRILFNFAYQSGNVRCYPDLVKVGVALDNGQIVEFSATGYLMNHTQRSFANPKYDLSAAQAKVSPRLSVNSGRLALIPTEGQHEVLCWEFNCTGSGKDRVLVYINCTTGMEQQILVLQSSDTGTLVR